MTREEEIYNAINNLQIGVYDEDISSDNDEYNNDEYNGSDLQDAFYAGATWADENPKSPWISVKDDLPCNHEEMIHSNYTDRVLVLSRNGYSEVAFMCLIEDAWEWNTLIKVLYWMPIPKLHHNAAI